MSSMKKIIFLFAVMITAASCSSVKVSHDFDKTANFSSYKTYTFTENAMALGLDDLNRKRVLDAIANELAAKGFAKTADNPDVLIDVNIKAVQQQTATATTSGGYGRYGWGRGYGTTTINYDSYVDGTLFISMIDAAKNQLVWEGRGTRTIEPDASAEKRESNIKYAVNQIFMNYPPKF
jgi:hypothetical protein